MNNLECNYLIQGSYVCKNNQNIIEHFAGGSTQDKIKYLENLCTDSIVTNVSKTGINLSFNEPLKTCKKELLNITHVLKEPLKIINTNNTFNTLSGYTITDEIKTQKEIMLLNLNLELTDNTINKNAELFFKNYVKFQLFIRVRVPGQLKSNDISISEQISYETSQITNPINIIIKPDVSYQLIGKISINLTELPISSDDMSKIQKTISPILLFSITAIEI